MDTCRAWREWKISQLVNELKFNFQIDKMRCSKSPNFERKSMI